MVDEVIIELHGSVKDTILCLNIYKNEYDFDQDRHFHGFFLALHFYFGFFRKKVLIKNKV